MPLTIYSVHSASRVLRISGPKRKEVTAGCPKLQCTQYWYGNLKREDHLEKPAADGGININTDLKETGCEGVGWIHLVQARHQWVGSCEHGNGSLY
jgi:hypothetical protein